MRKILALFLALVMTISLVTLPATAASTVVTANPEVTTNIKSVNIDGLDASINYFNGGSSTSASGLAITLSSGNWSIDSAKTGVVDSETNAITKYPVTAKKGTATIEEGYAKGENYDLIIGSALGATYPGSNADTTGRLVTGQPMKGVYLKKVADPVDPSNSVIEFNYGKTGNNNPATKYEGLITRLAYGKSTKMIQPAANGVPASKIDSGILAYEWNFYIPENSAKYMTTASSYINLGGIHADNTSGADMLADMTQYKNGKLTHSLYTHTFKSDGSVQSSFATSYDITPDTWHNIKQVIIIDDVALDSTNENYSFPLIAYYFDGQLVSTIRSRNKLLNGTSTGQVRFAFAPTAASTYADKSQNYNVYLDDLKQYWIAPLTISGLEDVYANFSPSADSVVINYTNPVDSEALKKAITVKRDGDVAENVTVNVETPDKYTAKVSFAGLNVRKATTYTVEISEFKDQYLSTATGKSFTITTKADVITSEDQINRIVTHNFDSDATGTNWIGKDESGNAVDNSPLGWDITSPRTSDTDTIKVVADPTGANHGNVLEYTTSSTSAGSNLRMLFDETSDTLVEDDILQPLSDERTVGRKLVVKYDVFVPSGGKAASGSGLPFVRARRDTNITNVNSSSNIFMSPSYAGGTTIGSTGTGVGNSNVKYATSYENRHNGTITSKTIPQGSWQTVTYVFDTSFTPDNTFARGNHRYRVYMGNDATLPYVSNWTYYEPDENGVIYDSTTSTLKGEKKSEEVGENDDKLYDLWPGELLKLGSGANGWAANYKGIFVLETTFKATRTSLPSTVYLDNFEVFAPELFTITHNNKNLDKFDASLHTIDYEFTTMVEPEMAKYVSLEDSNGEIIEDGIIVTFANDKRSMSVKVDPNAIEKNKDYVVRIDPQFHDIYMQGFDNEYKNIWTSTYYDVAIKTADVDFFEANANPKVFEGFKAGTDRTVEFTFTAPVATDVNNAFVVKDADGNVKTGWTATLSANKKVATVSLKGLDATGTFPYVISTTGDVKDANGRLIVAKTEVNINKAGKYEIFSDDYTDGFVADNYLVNNKATGADVGSFEVVADPAGSSNNVLKMTAKAVDSASAGFDFYLSRKPTKYDNVINFADAASPLFGKKLVLEMDNYTKKGYTQFNYNGVFMAFQRNSSVSAVADSSAYNGNYVRYNVAGKLFAVQNTSNGATKVAKNIYANRLNAGGSTSVTLDKWETFRIIFDQSDLTRHDTHRTYKLGENGSLTVTKAPYTYVTDVATLATTTTAKAAEGANKYPEYVYDFMSERMTNEKYLLFPGEENFTYNASNEYGKFYGLTFGWKAGTTESTRYVDNVRAYAVDPFKMVSFSSNVNEFIPEKSSTIEIGFNQTLYSDVEKLKANIMLLTKDENGEDVNVTDLISDITVNNSKDAVAITLNSAGLVDNKEYEIAFGPEFIDEYGQALAVYQSEILVDRSRIYGDYAVEFTSLPYEGFSASVNTAEISNFYAGADRSVIVTLTDATGLAQAELANAFKVTDKNGEVVTGWSAKLSADSKVITIDLSGLDATKAFPYTLTSLDTLVNDDAESAPVISVSISDLEGVYPIFEETFENFKENVEWKDNLDSNNWVTSANTGAGENTWKYVNSATSDLNSVMVVNETVGDRTGKFLKYTSGNSGTNNTPHILRNSNGNTGIKFNDANSDYYGKKLVYQVDVYFGDFVPVNNNYSTLLNFNNNADTKGEGTFARFNSNGVEVSSGVWGAKDYLRRTTLNLKNGWHTVTAVVDQTGTNPEIDYDNVRYYLDGNPVIVPYYDAATAQVKAPTYYMSNERQDANNLKPLFGTFFGTSFGAQSAGKSFYIDNLKAYAIDGVAFGIEEIDFNKATGVITAKFNSIIDDKFMSLVTIEDADGNIVSGGTKSILADGKTIEISGIIEPEFELFTAYKLKIDGLFRDIYLNEFNCYNDYEFEFVTARSGEISVANEPVANITETALTTTVEVCNRTSNSADLVMAVAVYNGYKLLGVQTVPVKLDALSDGTYNFNMAGDFTSATQVKIHFWDSISEMNALSIPEPVKLGE